MIAAQNMKPRPPPVRGEGQGASRATAMSAAASTARITLTLPARASSDAFRLSQRVRQPFCNGAAEAGSRLKYRFGDIRAAVDARFWKSRRTELGSLSI
jgi:hypothetical protein